MKELEEPIAAHRRSDLTHVSIHAIPGESEDERLAWKIEQKSNYSRPRKKWSRDELSDRFPDEKWTAEGLVADDGQMSRVFNTKGYEVARHMYRRKNPAKPNAFDTYIADFSEYDDDGYLMRYTYLEEHKIGFVATFDYITHTDGTKELSRTIEQDILRAGYIKPGKLTGTKFVIDFTDVPLTE